LARIRVAATIGSFTHQPGRKTGLIEFFVEEEGNNDG